ncbi:MAG: hypothetical protein HN675_15905 [Opitutae bacterium]|nr:hypothetical protein [Opitutae bacterium]MBT7854795.1 hypothetical protein [Opitutae bacterium]
MNRLFSPVIRHLFACLTTCLCTAAPPNFVVLFIDDMGYAEQWQQDQSSSIPQNPTPHSTFHFIEFCQSRRLMTINFLV